MFASSKPRLIAEAGPCSLQDIEIARTQGWSARIINAKSFEIPASIKAALFDFNGTIANTEPAYREALREALCKLFDLPSISDQLWGELRTSWNMSNMLTARTVLRSMRLLCPEYYARRMVGPEKVCQLQHEIFTTRLDSLPLSLMDGAANLVNGLETRGVNMGVVTGSHPAEVSATLGRFGLSKMLLYADFATDVNDDLRKPHPHLFAQAVSKQKVEVHQALAFENSVKGALSAVGAGLTTLVATSSPREFALLFSSQQREIAYQNKSRSESDRRGTLVLLPSLESVILV